MRHVKHLFSTFILLLCSVMVSAHDFEIDGIYYNITSEADKTAEVTFKGDSYDSYKNEYSGSITIPAAVTYDGVTYSVTSIVSRAFYQCNLTAITIPESVTSIGDYAFYGCSSLTSITIPESVTSIGWNAFYGCTGELIVNCNIPSPSDYNGGTFNGSKFTKVTIGESVTTIGDRAFSGCSSLTSITIPESVTSIGDYAFSGCSSLTSITIPESVTSIGDDAFNRCSSLTSITIPESVTSIGDYAFSGCSSLTSITIPESVTSIGWNAFNGCTGELIVNCNIPSPSEYNGGTFNGSKFTKVTIGESVTTIGESAFSGCSSLTTITIPEDVKSIGEWAFSGCSSLTSITLPEGVTSIGIGTFFGCSSLTSITIPESVTSIGSSAFYDCSSLTSITLPESVTSFGDLAFSGCSSLTSITIGDSVTSIGEGAFSGCNSLTSITIPESVTSIGGRAFSECTGELIVNCNISSRAFSDSKFTKVTIGDGVTTIGDNAFSGCSSLTSITIPESVTSIGKYAFNGCTGELIVNCNIPSPSGYDEGPFYGSKFTKVTIGESVTSIGVRAFKNCGSITSIIIPESVTSIGMSAFSGCNSLTSITIPESVTSIESSAFFGCRGELTVNCNIPSYAFSDSKFTKVTIGDGVTTIGNYAFYGCSNLTSITIPESVTSIGEGAFLGCSSLTSITIPESVTSIGSRAFSECTGELIVNCNIPSATSYSPGAFCKGKFTKVAIGDGVTSIGDYAFYDCSSLTSIVLPKSLKTVGSQAFAGCSSLSNVYCYAESVPSTKSDAFTNSNSENAILHVSDDALDSYKTTAPWSSFGMFLPLGKYITEIELSQPSVTLVEGETLSLSVTLTPEDTDLILIAWSSSNPDVAIVDKQGHVKAVAPGTATITATAIDGSEVSDSCEVTVRYADYVITYLVDGEVYATDTIGRTSAVTPLAEPVKEGYTFSGWSEIPETMPANDVTVSGSFTINKYLVNFALDGVVVSSNSLEYGTAIVAPEVAEREGYTFGGWQNLPETVPASDITINGYFTINRYTITYVVEEEVYHTDTIAFGSQITAVKYPVKEGYTFDGWSKAPEFMPAGDVTIIGTFSINSYKITYTVDGETLHADSIEYGDTIVVVAEPVKEGYTFSGWGEIPVTMPAKDVAVNGSFTINKYQITYMVGEDVYHTDSIAYGVSIPPVNNPVKEGYTFDGWDELPEKMPARDVITTGLFSVNSYKITYTVDGETLHADSIEYGDTIAVIAEPTREGYTFSGWSEIPETMPAKDVAVSGKFTINKYQITYIVGEDVYHTDSIAYGTYITSIRNPVKEGYTFIEWMDIPEKMPASDVTTIGSFSINKYKVTYTADNVTIYTDSIVYGGQIKDIASPTKEGYSFDGWEKVYQTMPARDIVINGTFTINKYQISYVVGGETIHTDSITYNERITPIDSPEQEGFNFSGWIGVPGIMPAYDVTVGGEFFIKNMQTDSQGLMYVLNEETETFELSNYEGNLTGTIVIPTDLYGYPVKGIKDRALMGAENLIHVVIPENISSVGYRVFYGCNNISYIEWETTAPVDAKCFDEPARHGNLLVYVKDTVTQVTYQGNVIVDGVAEKIVISNAQPLRNIRDFKARNISFTREFAKRTKIGTSGGWEAMVLPFDVQHVVSETRGELKPFGEADFDTSLPYWLGELQADGSFAAVQTITANKPFIMQLPNSDEYEDRYNVEGKVTFSAEEVTVHATTDVEQEKGVGYSLLGSYEGIESDNYIYALNDEEYAVGGDTYMPGGVFVAGSRDIRPFEAYIYSASANRAPYLRIGGCDTGMEDLVTDKEEVWHTLQGIRLSGRPTERGVYIRNGKKVMVK